jgi:hypothetical protein
VSNKNYVKGRNLEYRTWAKYRKKDYLVFRQHGSKGIQDLTCVPSVRSGFKKILFIQVKWNRRDMTKEQKSGLALFASYYGGVGILEYRDPKTKHLVTEILELA